MSVPATVWAWRQPVATAAQRVVLLALADHANGAGECWPAVTTIAARCALHRGTVRRVLGELKDAGLIAKVERRHRADGTRGTWLYRLLVPPGWVAVDNHETKRAEDALSPNGKRAEDALSPNGKRAEDALGRCTERARTVHRARAESLIEPFTESLGARELENDTARAVDNHTRGTRAYSAVAPAYNGRTCPSCGRPALERWRTDGCDCGYRWPA